MLLYALASLCGAGVLVAVAFERITQEMLSGAFAQIGALPTRSVKMALLVGAAVLVVLGLSLISAMFPPKKKRSSSFAIQQNENGTVRISLKTIDALVQKCLNQHAELRVVTSALYSDEESVRVDIHINLQTDISMPLAISALQKQIKKYLEACSGVQIQEVRIFVEGMIPATEDTANSPYALPTTLLGGESEALPAAEQPEEAEVAPEKEEKAEEVVVQETEQSGETVAAQEESAAEPQEAEAE